MPDGVASLLGRAAPWLLTYLLHSTALIAVAWTLERSGVVCRPRSLDALWKAALLGGFVTSAVVVLRAASPPAGALARVQAVVRADAGPPAENELTWTSPEGVTRLRTRLAEPSPACRERIRSAPGGAEWLDAVKEACLPSRPAGRALLVAAWLVGAGGLILLGHRARRQVAAVLADARPADALTRGRRRPGSPPVVFSESVPAPCAVGGRVLLPARCEEEMGDGELTAVLAHELAHLERRDPAWLAAADLVRRVAWIQPLNRLAATGVRDAAELATDERTLRHARPLDLARSIHRVSSWTLPGVRVAHLAGLTSSREGSSTRRVRRILRGGPDGLGSAWPGALLALGLTAGALLLPPVATTRVVHALVIERTVEGAVPEDVRARDVTAVLSGDPGRARVVVRAVRATAVPPAPTPSTP